MTIYFNEVMTATERAIHESNKLYIIVKNVMT